MKRYNKYIKLFKIYMDISLKTNTVFKNDFMVMVFHLLVYSSAFIIFWNTILSNMINPIVNWNFPKLAILNGVILVSSGIGGIFWGVISLPDKIVEGQADKYFSKPINPLFGLIAEEISFAVVQQLFSGMIIIVITILYYKLTIKIEDVILCSITIILGNIILALIRLSLALLSFWYGRVSNILRIFESIISYQRYPTNIYPMKLQNVLTFIFPLFFIVTLPTLMLIGEYSINIEIVFTVLSLIIVWSTIVYITWKKALKRYESFGG